MNMYRCILDDLVLPGRVWSVARLCKAGRWKIPQPVSPTVRRRQEVVGGWQLGEPELFVCPAK